MQNHELLTLASLANRALRLEDELARLERNKERRFVREKAKGLHGDATSPGAAGDPSAGGSGTGKTAGTQRKCANCGMVGHIKTNKKCYNCLSSTPFMPSSLSSSFNSSEDLLSTASFGPTPINASFPPSPFDHPS